MDTHDLSSCENKCICLNLTLGIFYGILSACTLYCNMLLNEWLHCLHLQKGHTNDPWYNGPGSAHLVFEIPLRRSSPRPRLRPRTSRLETVFETKTQKPWIRCWIARRGTENVRFSHWLGRTLVKLYPRHPNVQPISRVSTRWFLESTRPHANVLKLTNHRAHKLFSWYFQIITLLHSGSMLLKQFLCSFIPVLP